MSTLTKIKDNNTITYFLKKEKRNFSKSIDYCILFSYLIKIYKVIRTVNQAIKRLCV